MPNAAMAQKILDIQKKHPGNFYMGDWLRYDSEPVDIRPISLDFPVEEINICGTTLCGAGWAAVLDGWTILKDSYVPVRGEDEFPGWARAGQAALGICDLDKEILFYIGEDAALNAFEQLAKGAERVDWSVAGIKDLGYYIEITNYDDAGMFTPIW